MYLIEAMKFLINVYFWWMLLKLSLDVCKTLAMLEYYFYSCDFIIEIYRFYH